MGYYTTIINNNQDKKMYTSKQKRNKSIHIVIPDYLRKELAFMAQQKGVSESEIIRDLIKKESFLNEQKAALS